MNEQELKAMEESHIAQMKLPTAERVDGIRRRVNARDKSVVATTAELDREYLLSLMDIGRPTLTVAAQGDWVLVPREPTEEMLTAAGYGDATDEGKDYVRLRYQAMLSASPAPTQPAQDVEITLHAGRVEDGGATRKDQRANRRLA